MAASKTLTPEQRTERARKAGRASQARLTPQQRQESAAKARLSAAVNAVVGRMGELTPEQRESLRAIFAPTAKAGPGQ
jgi:hypothetical protein